MGPSCGENGSVQAVAPRTVVRRRALVRRRLTLSASDVLEKESDGWLLQNTFTSCIRFDSACVVGHQRHMTPESGETKRNSALTLGEMPEREQLFRARDIARTLMGFDD